MIPSRLSIIAMRKEMVKTGLLPAVSAILAIRACSYAQKCGICDATLFTPGQFINAITGLRRIA